MTLPRENRHLNMAPKSAVIGSYSPLTGRRGLRRMPSLARQGREDGIALVVAMILLIVITLMGLAAVRGTIMQQKMTANFYDRQLAFQASEAGLRQAEAAIQAATAPGPFLDCSPTAVKLIACLADPTNDPQAATAITTVGSSFTQGSAGTSVAPQYVIEYMGYFAVPAPKTRQLSNATSYGANVKTYAYFYRITAWSGPTSGPTTVQDRASVTLQSFYMR